MLKQDRHTLYSQQNSLDSTYEDLHWLVLIAGFTLCDIVESEDILIPSPLMRDSIRQQSEVQSSPVDVSSLVWREGAEQVELSSAKLG